MFPDNVPSGYLFYWSKDKPIPEGWGEVYVDGRKVTASLDTIIIMKLDNLTWIEQEAQKRKLI